MEYSPLGARGKWDSSPLRSYIRLLMKSTSCLNVQFRIKISEPTSGILFARLQYHVITLSWIAETPGSRQLDERTTATYFEGDGSTIKTDEKRDSTTRYKWGFVSLLMFFVGITTVFCVFLFLRIDSSAIFVSPSPFALRINSGPVHTGL